VSWKIYYSDLPFGAIFAYVRQPSLAANLAKMDPDDAKNPFLLDAAAGTLPQVSFVDPSFIGETENDEHPPTSIQVGQAFVAKIVNAVLGSPLWNRTALILTYDEHGGFYDHVSPPPACKPDDTAPLLAPGDEPGEFDRYGIRVPFVVVSPFARRQFVSHRTYDHTSVLRFIETRFDLPALTRRDANADPLLELFDFRKPAFKKPPRLPAATIASGHDECPPTP
jgi:phospholipase C